MINDTNIHEIKVAFAKRLSEVLQYICSESCWTSQIVSKLEEVLKAGADLGVYSGSVKIEKTDAVQLRALHTLCAYKTLLIVIVSHLDLQSHLDFHKQQGNFRF